jgi:REP element-mobilizing transposase RayT
MSTVAIHTIWTTYGTWLPGDPRGHWSPLFDFYGRLIERGDKLNIPDRVTHDFARSELKEQEKVLSAHDREIVAQTIGSTLSTDLEGRAEILAAAIERTHVHLLWGELPFDIEKVIGRIKSKTSSAVIHSSTAPDRERTWTKGYWRVFVFDVTAIPDIQNYIENHNVRSGLPRCPYKWISPFI